VTEGVTTSFPDTPFAPLHPFDAAQEVTLVVVHPRVTLSPAPIEVGTAESETIGVLGVVAMTDADFADSLFAASTAETS
jgi:hypothetical protein